MWFSFRKWVTNSSHDYFMSTQPLILLVGKSDIKQLIHSPPSPAPLSRTTPSPPWVHQHHHRLKVLRHLHPLLHRSPHLAGAEIGNRIRKQTISRSTKEKPDSPANDWQRIWSVALTRLSAHRVQQEDGRAWQEFVGLLPLGQQILAPNSQNRFHWEILIFHSKQHNTR